MQVPPDKAMEHERYQMWCARCIRLNEDKAEAIDNPYDDKSGNRCDRCQGPGPLATVKLK